MYAVDLYIVCAYSERDKCGVGAYIEPFRVTKTWEVRFVEFPHAPDDDYVWEQTAQKVSREVRVKSLIPHYVAFQPMQDAKDRKSRRNNNMWRFVKRACDTRFAEMLQEKN